MGNQDFRQCLLKMGWFTDFRKGYIIVLVFVWGDSSFIWFFFFFLVQIQTRELASYACVGSSFLLVNTWV